MVWLSILKMRYVCILDYLPVIKLFPVRILLQVIRDAIEQLSHTATLIDLLVVEEEVNEARPLTSSIERIEDGPEHGLYAVLCRLHVIAAGASSPSRAIDGPSGTRGAVTLPPLTRSSSRHTRALSILGDVTELLRLMTARFDRLVSSAWIIHITLASTNRNSRHGERCSPMSRRISVCSTSTRQLLRSRQNKNTYTRVYISYNRPISSLAEINSARRVYSARISITHIPDIICLRCTINWVKFFKWNIS